MRTILILMDSLNRRFLNSYGNDWVQTPNIDRLAARGATFDNHYVGSLPCMPARRDMMTGRLSFLETPWGPIEPWDDCAPTILRQEKNVYTHLITDHYHYFHRGGGGYHYLFSSWEFLRGQEFDVWHPLIDAGDAPEPDVLNARGLKNHAFRANRDPRFRDMNKEEDYPTVQCFQQAMEFVDLNHDQDNWHLHLEVFDPHEPFECPKEYLEMYGDDYEGNDYYFPHYMPLGESDTPEAVAHVRKRYAGSLTMADKWLGKLLDKMDEHDLWEDTTIILTTDHGHMLGEHGLWAKNYMLVYQELAHIPMVVWGPNVEAGSRIEALTTTVDLMPTLLELHGASIPEHRHGKSMVHLFDKDEPHHESVLFGYFGKDVNYTDGKRLYCRQPEENATVYAHTANLGEFGWNLEMKQNAETGRFLKHGHGIPQYRVEHGSSRHRDAPDFNPIYDLESDYVQETPIRDEKLEAELASKLKAKLEEFEAPDCQFTRLNL